MQEVFNHHRATIPFPSWVIRDFRYCFKSFCKSVIQNKEIVYSNLDSFKEYKDSTVFILGGGPSTNAMDLDSVDRDYTWSCNHFYLNEKIKNMKIDLAMIFGEPDIQSSEFKSYLDKYHPHVGFECHDRWVNYNFDDYDKYFCMHTRFYSKLGGGARMVLFASFLGAKHVYFTGFDGPEAMFEGNHAFQPGKTTLPSSYSNMDHNKVVDKWKKQSDYFWNYTTSLFPNVKYTNLGGGDYYHEKIR